ncbi:hypothetical protein [Spirosoma fluviale]|uniref:Lasso RiPP family leader peptide-containing protein n=1 Tax=Spirosoma fluviale TaxID=1597977 RepID=A0A286F613_9BACT|nr:hypothetical protein [Spirosoma fluviale]SOD78638.1 hypothetical protein SAMN06269250_0562 [Spirosoma fluviale]
MKSTKKDISTPLRKKAYRTPTLKALGNVKKITLKTGSSVDGFGTFG